MNSIRVGLGSMNSFLFTPDRMCYTTRVKKITVTVIRDFSTATGPKCTLGPNKVLAGVGHGGFYASGSLRPCI